MISNKNAFNSSNRKLKTTVGPIDRKKAKLEAELGETVLTNLSEGNNIYELKMIGGKKHSKGGTPLDLPSGKNPGEGSSFIFSDNKKLMVKDKEELAFFGIKNSKGMTPAEISAKHIDAIAKSKAIILDKYADTISKKAAEKNLDNSRFVLSSLSLWQESKKGMKDGSSDQFQTFFDKTKTTPEDMFTMKPEQEQALGQQMEAAFGGQLKSYSTGGNVKSKYTITGLPEFNKGGGYKVYKESDLPSDAVIKEQGLSNYKVNDFVKQPDGTYYKVNFLDLKTNEVNTKTKNVDITNWANESEENKNTLAIANEAIQEGIKKGFILERPKGSGNIKITGKFKPDFRTKVAISEVLNKSGQGFKTDKYKVISQGYTSGYSGSKGSFVAGFTPEDYEKRYALEKLRAQGYNKEESFSELDKLYADPEKAKELRKEFTGFLGIAPGENEDVYSDDFYKKNYGKVTSGIESKLLQKNEYRPKYGDDSLSGFEHFDAFGMSATPGYEPGEIADPYDAKADTVEHLDETVVQQNPWGFRKEDINSLNRAINAKQNLRRYDPWSKATQYQTPETMFKSPERAIAAVNEQLAQGVQGIQSFGTPGQSASAISEMQGNAYAQVANTINQYDSDNVGIFNAASDRNTQLANVANAQDAQMQTNMFDKRNALKQNFDNSLSAAKDKITELSNQAWTNASNIHNLNLNTENFKKDPYTGIIYKTGDKPVVPIDADKTSADAYTDFASRVTSKRPGITESELVKLWIKKEALAGDDYTADVTDSKV